MAPSQRQPHCPLHSPYMEPDTLNFLTIERTKEWPITFCVECMEAMQAEWRRKELDRIKPNIPKWFEKK